MQQSCLFERAGYRFAVPVEAVREVLRPTALTRLPGTPPEILGITAQRGAVLPVLQIDDWLYLPRRDLGPETPILCLEAAGVRMGILVDRVLGAVSLPPPGPAEEPFAAPVACGRSAWEEGPVVCLDPERMVQTALHAVQSAVEEWRRGRVEGAPEPEPADREGREGDDEA